MTRHTKFAATLALAAVLGTTLLASGCTTKVVTAPAASSPASTVTASGSGTVSAAPDIAVMSFGVSASSSNAKSALDGVSAKATKVSAALKKAGVADKDIQTQNISIYPQTDRNNKITGYQSSLSVSAKVRDLGKLGEVISAATSAGTGSADGPTFSISQDAPYSAEAIKMAVDDARQSATAMANAAGKSLGGVVSITSNGPAATPIGFTGHRLAAAAVAVPVQPGQLDVTSDLTVVFALK
jgi:uncharacterized protein YggE